VSDAEPARKCALRMPDIELKRREVTFLEPEIQMSSDTPPKVESKEPLQPSPPQDLSSLRVEKVLSPAARRALAEAAERRALAESEYAKALEEGGPSGPEPTRYGDWERKGIAVDF